MMRIITTATNITISEIDEDLLTIKVVVGLVSLIVIFVAVVIILIIYTSYLIPFYFEALVR
jgi:sensor histidine kinase YesM